MLRKQQRLQEKKAAKICRKNREKGLGIGAGSGTDNVVAAKGGNIIILDPESASGERGDPIELDGENQDGQPRVEDPALEAGGGGKDGSAGGG